MQQQEQYQTILTSFDYQLFCSITNHGQNMKLILLITLPKRQILQANLDDMSKMGGLRHNCGSFYDVRDYLRNGNNFQIDRDNMVMIVYDSKVAQKRFMLTCIKFDFVEVQMQQEAGNNRQHNKKIQKELEQRQQMEEKVIIQQYLQKKKEQIIQQVLKRSKINQFQAHIEQMIYRMQQKSIIINQQMSKKLIQFQDTITMVQQQKKPLKQISPYNWIDTQSYYIRNGGIKIKFDIIIESDGYKQNFLFGKERIQENCKFFVKIINICEYIGIGIADRCHVRSGIYTDQYMIFYYRSDKYERNARIKAGMGFKQGEIVEVDVSLQNSCILWKVQKQIRYKLDRPLSSQIDWVPFIVFMGKNSSVAIYKRF